MSTEDSITSTPSLLGELLESTALRMPQKEAVVFNGQSLTWGELNRQVDSLAQAFLDLGVERGDRIGVISTTRPEYLCVYFAAARIGAMMVGFNVQNTPLELERLAALTTPKVMVVLDKYKDKPVAPVLKPFFDAMPFVQAYGVIGEEVPEGAYPLSEWTQTEASPMVLAQRKAELHSDDGVLIVFTSGSTGVPKAAVLTHRALLANCAVQAREFCYAPEDRVLQNKPMNHVGGTSNLTLPSIATGATLVFMDHFHPARVLEMIEQERISILGQVPTMFIMEMNLPNYRDYDLSSLRLAIVGGAATPVPVMYGIKEMAGTVMTGFGMSETCGYISYTSPTDPTEVTAITTGAIAPEFEWRIVDDARQTLTEGQVGEVAVRGACLFKEYLGNPEATAEVKDAEGWLYSGDLGFMDERGYITLVDRKKEMYISGGYNVYPREIEHHIADHPEVELVAVLGTKDPIMGEVGIACVTAKPGAQLTPETIKQHCQVGLAEYKIPRHFLILESLPFTPLGKIDKPRLRQELHESRIGS